ncbi:MAG: hypothetical protein M0Q15_15655 [Nevskia sp.]|nr:hypothetical protein [Nevskia sp.]
MLLHAQKASSLSVISPSCKKCFAYTAYAALGLAATWGTLMQPKPET